MVWYVMDPPVITCVFQKSLALYFYYIIIILLLFPPRYNSDSKMDRLVPSRLDLIFIVNT